MTSMVNRLRFLEAGRVQLFAVRRWSYKTKISTHIIACSEQALGPQLAVVVTPVKKAHAATGSSVVETGQEPRQPGPNSQGEGYGWDGTMPKRITFIGNTQCGSGPSSLTPRERWPRSTLGCKLVSEFRGQIGQGLA